MPTGLIFKYGNFAHPAGEVELVMSDYTREYGDTGLGLTERIGLQVKGILLADAETFTARINEMNAAYAVDGRDAVLYREDGTTPTHMAFYSADTIDGIRVVNPPKFPIGKDTELVNLRTYEIGLEFTRLVSGQQANVLAFSEFVDTSGGGGRFDFLVSLVGLPQAQTLNLYTPFEAVQGGSAIGLATWPHPPDPIWPGDLIENPRIRRESPKRSGPIGQPRFSDYPISWEYRFKAVAPFFGVPHQANF